MEESGCAIGFAATVFAAGTGCRADCPQPDNNRERAKKGKNDWLLVNGRYFLTGFLVVLEASTAARVGVPLQQAMPPFAQVGSVLTVVLAAAGFAVCATAAELNQQKSASKAEQPKRLIYSFVISCTGLFDQRYSKFFHHKISLCSKMQKPLADSP